MDFILCPAKHISTWNWIMNPLNYAPLKDDERHQVETVCMRPPARYLNTPAGIGLMILKNQGLSILGSQGCSLMKVQSQKKWRLEEDCLLQPLSSPVNPPLYVHSAYVSFDSFIRRCVVSLSFLYELLISLVGVMHKCHQMHPRNWIPFRWILIF